MVAAVPPAAEGADTPADQEWAFATYGNDVGKAGFVLADLDGDGSDEVVATSVADEYPWERYVSVLEATAAGYAIARFSRPIEGSLTALSVFDGDGDGAVEIYLGFDDRLEIRDPITLAVTTTLTEPSSAIRKIVLADGDNDGSLEIIACGEFTTTWIYDAQTGAFERSIGHFGDDLAVGDVDGDPALEMVFANGDVVQLASGVATVEWTLPGAAGGQLVELGNIDGDPQLEIFFVSDWQMKVYDFGVATVLWQIDAEVTALVVTDVAGDPVPEVVWGEGQWGSVHCHDGVTGTELWSIPNPQWGFLDLLVADTDNDGELEVFWSNYDNRILVHSAVTLEQEWNSGPSVDGPFEAIATGDPDDDGELEVLFASTSSDNGYGDGIVFMFDALSHELQWQTGVDTFGGHAWSGLRDIAVGDVDDDGRDEVVVAGDDLYDGAVFVFQNPGMTPDASYVYPDYGVMRALAIADVDHDGATEIVAASDGMVHVIDGATGVMEWTGPNSVSAVRHLAVANLDLDPALEIVVGDESLRVFDGITHVQWTSPGSGHFGLDVVDVDPGPPLEIVAGSGGDLVVYQSSGPDTFAEIDRFTVSPEPVGGVTGYRDIEGDLTLAFASAGAVSAFRVADETIVWSAGPFGRNAGLDNNLESVEIATDTGALVLVGSVFSVHQLGGPQAAIFADGFETGDTSRWSTVTP